MRCGKYFEARFFLNVIAYFGHTKSVSVQLPIILIHMNSLDVVPNSVARVAAAIEEKKGGHEPYAFDAYQERHLGCDLNPDLDRYSSNDPRRTRSVQGRAFSAPRAQSLERMRARQGEWDELGRLLERSPRKQAPYIKRTNSTGSAPANATNSPKRPARPSVGQATIFEVGPDNAEVLVSRRRPSQDKSDAQPLPLHTNNANNSLDTSRDAPERSPGMTRPPLKPASHKSSSTNSTPRFLRRLASFGSIHYRTPPSNRKARAFAKEDADKLRNCLQHKPSSDSAISKPASPKPIWGDFQARRPAPPTPTHSGNRKRGRGRTKIAMSPRLRDRERRVDASAKGRARLDGADSDDKDEREERGDSHAPGTNTGRHGIRNFKDKLEASGFEVRWLKFRGKGREEREEEERKRDNEDEMERLGWI